MRELSENESVGGDLSCSDWDSDNGILLLKNESTDSGEIYKDDDSFLMDLDEYVARDSTEWKIFKATSLPGSIS